MDQLIAKTAEYSLHKTFDFDDGILNHLGLILLLAIFRHLLLFTSILHFDKIQHLFNRRYDQLIDVVAERSQQIHNGQTYENGRSY